MADSPGSNDVLKDSMGETPKVSESLEVTNRAIADVEQAIAVCSTIIEDWKKGIQKAAKITSKLNGQKPYHQGALKQQLKDYKTNISTGFLATECSKVLPRLFMPIKTAKYVTAAQLPAGWPDGPQKTEHFRQVITDAVRSWPKFNFYLRGKAREVGIFGFAFDVWFDQYDWRPSLLRMDRGFVPQGTEITEEPPFFVAKWPYKPNELLDLLKANQEAGRDEWQKDNVIKAINNATPSPVNSTQVESRSYEDLIRQSSYAYTYSKGAKVISTWHLFAKEATGKVSHYVILADGTTSGINDHGANKEAVKEKLLFEYLDEYNSMHDAALATVFDYGDGTIHGSLGAGHILYDLSVQVEKIRCDSIDNMRLTNKVKLQVKDAKNINDVKLTINDQLVVASGAEFAGNMAGLSCDVEGYEQLEMKLSKIAQEKIGAFVPPIPLQPSDIKAAQINAALSKEKELQEALLENWLIQWAMVVRTMVRRLCDPNSPDDVAVQVRQDLLKKLTEEEIAILVSQFPVKSVLDFTEMRAQQRGQFAASVLNNPLFKQQAVARIMAEGAGDQVFVDSIVIPEGDMSDVNSAANQQKTENAAMAIGQPMSVLPSDNDWVHMQTLKEQLGPMLMSDNGNPDLMSIGLQHYAAHWSQGVNKKSIPADQINNEKQWIASAEKTIQAHRDRQALAQQTQAVAAQAGGLPPTDAGQVQ